MGVTEATVITHLYRQGTTRLGSVGKVLLFLKHRIAPDDEFLLCSPLVRQGYLKKPETTAEILVDGSLHTADIGAIADQGDPRITDRTKYIVIPTGDKYVAPANIEQVTKANSPLVGQVHPSAAIDNTSASSQTPSKPKNGVPTSATRPPKCARP